MPRKKTSSPKASELSFEQAMADLEEIVTSMEEEELPLEELVTKYETGTRLLGRCEEVLKSAKKKIQTIAENRAGEESVEGDQGGSKDLDEQDDDIRLF